MRAVAVFLIVALVQANANPFLPDFMKPSKLISKGTEVVQETANTVTSVVSNPEILLKPDELMGKVSEVQKSLTDGVSEGVETVEKAVSDATKELKEKVEGAVEEVKTRAEGIVEEVKAGVESVTEKAQAAANNLGEQVNKIQETVAGTASDITGQIKEVRETATNLAKGNFLQQMFKPVIQWLEELRDSIAKAFGNLRTSTEQLVSSAEETVAAVEEK